MASRRELQERREKLRQWFIESCDDGTLKPGAMLPPVRELALQHGVSASSAFEIVRELAEAGLLYTLHGAGTFVGRLPTRDDLFLLVLPDALETRAASIAIRNGFESYLTRLGGTCLTLSRQKASVYQASQQLEGLVGVGELCSLADERSWEGAEPHVALREMQIAGLSTDTVYIDNEDAGRRAMQHLLALGHSRIAFLGVHSVDGSDAGSLDWSRQRQEGWLRAGQRAGYELSDLVFCPPYRPRNSHLGLQEAGRIAGKELALRLRADASEVTAVIVSNSHSTQGMFEALQEARVEEERWPAVVSFDDFTTSHNNLLSVLRPPWEELGRQGAALLWERRQGRLEPPTQQRPVSMELIPRFSCRPRQLRVPRPAVISPGVVAV